MSHPQRLTAPPPLFIVGVHVHYLSPSARVGIGRLHHVRPRTTMEGRDGWVHGWRLLADRGVGLHVLLMLV
jgi:hypothetical protein